MPNQTPQLIDDLRKKVLEDQNFRHLLKTDTKKALSLAHIDPTPKNVALVRNVIDSIENLYDGFEEIDRFIT